MKIYVKVSLLRGLRPKASIDFRRGMGQGRKRSLRECEKGVGYRVIKEGAECKGT